MDMQILKLGLGDWSVAAAFYLNIFTALACCAYAFYTTRASKGNK